MPRPIKVEWCKATRGSLGAGWVVGSHQIYRFVLLLGLLEVLWVLCFPLKIHRHKGQIEISYRFSLSFQGI
jgi:hypothetical protein